MAEGAHGTGGCSEEGKASGRRQHPSRVFWEKALAKQKGKGREGVLTYFMSGAVIRTLLVFTH